MSPNSLEYQSKTGLLVYIILLGSNPRECENVFAPSISTSSAFSCNHHCRSAIRKTSTKMNSSTNNMIRRLQESPQVSAGCEVEGGMSDLGGPQHSDILHHSIQAQPHLPAVAEHGRHKLASPFQGLNMASENTQRVISLGLIVN
jgi:hypothetical protein